MDSCRSRSCCLVVRSCRWTGMLCWGVWGIIYHRKSAKTIKRILYLVRMASESTNQSIWWEISRTHYEIILDWKRIYNCSWEGFFFSNSCVSAVPTTYLSMITFIGKIYKPIKISSFLLYSAPPPAQKSASSPSHALCPDQFSLPASQ